MQVVDAKQMDAATEQIGAVLRERHHIRYEDDFTIRSQQDMLESANQITGVLTLFLGGIAGISLLVGGIGIMNIMLVSVTERTREIGIRKAIGATRKNILTQFLTEATILSVLGGLIGVGRRRRALRSLISGLSVGTMTLQPVIAHGLDPAGDGFLAGHRAVLRHLPGLPGGAPEPDRRAALRMRWDMKIFSRVSILAVVMMLAMLVAPGVSQAADLTSGAAATTSTAQRSSGHVIVFQFNSGGAIYAMDPNGKNLRYLTTGMDPALSPDGKQVAFTRWDGQDNGVTGSVWVINVDGTGERQVAAGANQPKSPTWSARW